MESALMSESDDEAYGAGKGGIVAMTPKRAFGVCRRPRRPHRKLSLERIM
jgi:hypothetical protein